jgi:hypothetical protein
MAWRKELLEHFIGQQNAPGRQAETAGSVLDEAGFGEARDGGAVTGEVGRVDLDAFH